jgi:hypothetical protein
MMTMPAMLDDHQTFRAGAVPTALAIAVTLTDRDVNTGAHSLAALATHSLAPLSAIFAPHSLAALAANFHAALRAVTLFAHFATALLRTA